MKRIIFILIAIYGSGGGTWLRGQERLETLKGFVLQAKNRNPLSGANIINLSRLRGATSGPEGYFTIGALPGDTLVVSYLGFKSYKWVTDSLSFGRIQRIYLQEAPFVLQEVVINGHELTGVLPVDLALMPKRDIPQINLHLETQFGDTTSNILTQVNDRLRKIFDPVGLIYNFFSNHGKDLRKLRRLKERDEITHILAAKFDRQILSDLLGVDEKEVYQVLEWCDYDKKFLQTASDLQILEALRSCYEKHRALMDAGQ